MNNNVNRDEPGEEGGERSLCKSEGGGHHSQAEVEVEVKELKDVLQVLKASKADKEALEGGDINSILFASAGLGGGGSGGGTGLLKTSLPGVDLGGNCEVTFKLKVRLKSVPRLDVETSTSVWEVINFISNFEIKMRSLWLERL